jgi:hypothetical protein
MSIKYTDQSRPINETKKLIRACQERGITAERLYGEKEILIEPNSAFMAQVPLAEHA